MVPTSLCPTGPAFIWDIFCRVVDNFGDMGVCWRLCVDLAGRGHSVRFWTDDTSARAWMAPGAREGRWARIDVHHWQRATDPQFVRQLPQSHVWIEAFGCEIAPEFIATHAISTSGIGNSSLKPPVWLNLEYLSAESYVERCHGLALPQKRPVQRASKVLLIYPGFGGTGGFAEGTRLSARHAALALPASRAEWLAAHRIRWAGEPLVSMFCYEPTNLARWLKTLDQMPNPSQVLVTAGRATQEVQRLQTGGLSAPEGKL